MLSGGQIILIIGILALLDSLFVLTFPEISFRVARKILRIRHRKTLKKIVWTEFIISLILMVVGMNV